MATYLDNLKARRQSIAEELADLDAGRAGGKPDNTGSGGGTQHTAYRLSLYTELESLDARIAQAELDPDLGGEGPFEVTSEIE